MSKNVSIELPQVKMLNNGQVLDAKAAQELASKPHIVTYQYAGAEWAMAIDPNAIKSDAEDRVEAVQMSFADLDAVKKLPADQAANLTEADNEQALQVLGNIGGSDGIKQMTEKLRELTLAQIDMLAPAVIGCNDPVHPVTVESLKSGGMVAKQQLKALLQWWNPTEPPSEAETNTTDNQKSTD